MLRATSCLLQKDQTPDWPIPFDLIVLPHDERHLRRKRITLQHGDSILVDLAESTALESGDRLVLEDGRHVEVIAGEEDLMAVSARDGLHHAELCWHIGNRHLAAQIEADRILLLRDPVIEKMLHGLGASTQPVSEPFHPTRGAYHSHGAHSHG